MPYYYGIPTSPEIILSSVQKQIESFITYIQFPTYTEINVAFLSSTKDTIVATKSTCYFIFLICRPIVLTVQLMFLYIWPYLQIVFHYTLRHAWNILRNFVWNTKIGTIKFMKFQRSLSTASIVIELCAIASLIGLYFLRRYIQRKRYVERLNDWYYNKKRNIVKQYENVITRVSETSEICGLLLPHTIFFLSCANVKYLLPDIVRYIVTQTVAMEIIMLWVPLYQTISFLSMKKKQKATKVDEQQQTNTSKEGKKTTTMTRDAAPTTTVTAKSSIAMKYLQSSLSSKILKSSINTDGSDDNKQQQQLVGNKHDAKTNAFEIRKSAISLLQFWTVYSLLNSCYEIIQIIPFIQSIFSPIISRISIDFLKEATFFFWIWLRYLPITSRSNTKKFLGATPTLMLYSKLTPVALYFGSHVNVAITTTSNQATNSNNSTSMSSFSSSVYQKLNSLFDIAIFFKLLTANTKETIFSVVSDSRLLFPGFLTIFMPSMFTQYGCIYIRSIVPSISSIQCCEEAHTTTRNINRWLKYWVIQALVQCLLSSSYQLPFKTHISLLIWLYLNLPFEKYVGACFIYELLEYEFIGFGLLSPKDGTEDLDMHRTLTLRSVAFLIARLPSSVNSENKSDSATSSSSSLIIEDNTNNTAPKKESLGQLDKIISSSSTSTEVTSAPALLSSQKINEAKKQKEISDTKVDDDTKDGKIRFSKCVSGKKESQNVACTNTTIRTQENQTIHDQGQLLKKKADNNDGNKREYSEFGSTTTAANTAIKTRSQTKKEQMKKTQEEEVVDDDDDDRKRLFSSLESTNDK